MGFVSGTDDGGIASGDRRGFLLTVQDRCPQDQERAEQHQQERVGYSAFMSGRPLAGGNPSML